MAELSIPCPESEPILRDTPANIVGRRRAVALREGLALVISDYRYLADADYQHFGGAHLKLHYKLKGRTAVRGDAGEFEAVEADNLTFVVQPEDSIKHERVTQNTEERSVTLICSRAFVHGMLPNDGEHLPKQIASYLRSRTPRFAVGSRRISPAMRATVSEMLAPTGDRLGELLIEAKALELFCETVRCLATVPANAVQIRPRDRIRVSDLCAILQQDAAGHHQIGDLAKLLAWNKSQMMECFKLVTGMTISNYRHHIRMQQAKRKLRDTDASITEIAFDAGFEHPSNFATAYRRMFGHAPHQARAGYN